MLSRVENQCLLSSKLGDGGFYQNGKTHYFLFVSKELDYLNYKLTELLKAKIPMSEDPIGITKSGYKEGNFSHHFITRNSDKLTRIANMSRAEAISKLTTDGLIMFYLEDGSYHQKKNFMHLYCNAFTIEEVVALKDKIFQMYPVKECVLRWDRKRDGREYPYLYIPVSVANVFKIDVKDFLLRNNITSLLYKTGSSPSTTIESTNKESV